MKKQLLLMMALLTAICANWQNSNAKAIDHCGECSKFEKALPVWAEGRENEENLYLAFREILPQTKARRVEIRITAQADYRMKLNGEFVAHGPCVAAHDFYRIDVYDITHMLSTGKNLLTIEVAGYNIESYYLLKQPSFLQAEIVADGKVIAYTGKDFNAYELTQRISKTEKFSFQRPTAEEYVLDADYDKWTSDMMWQGNTVKLAVQREKATLKRGVPYPDYRIHGATALKKDLFKFKCNSTGFLCMKIDVTEPSHLKVVFDELLGDDFHVNYHRMNTKACLTYDLEPGCYCLESFEPYTMEYVEFLTEKGHVDVEYVYMRDYCGADVWKARFKSDNEVLNTLFEVARETHRQNALDIFMDCPSRERAGWLCDSYFSARVAFDFSGNTRIEHNFIENFLLPKEFKHIDRGMLPMCYPSDHGNKNYIPNWAMWFVLELEEYLHRTGDKKLILQAKEKVYNLVNYFKPYLNEDGLLEKLSKWIFVEWSDANKYVQDVNYPSNMLYARMLDAIANLYNDPSLAAQAEKIRNTIRRQAWDGNFFCDNAIRTSDGRLTRTGNHTEACQYYAFYCKTATPELYPDLWKKLRDEFGPDRKTSKAYPDVPFANAFIGNYLRLELLSEAGLSRQLLDECLAEYTKMAAITGTLWENMTPTASCNHGFAAHIEHVLLRDILGVYDVSPSDKTVTLRFLDSDVKHCSGTIPVQNEQIEIEWHNTGGIFTYKLSLPKGYKVSISPTSMPCRKIN